MSSAPLPPKDGSVDGRDHSSDVPRDYGDAYRRAYRRSMAEHPTELLSPARPGKRASSPSPSSFWRARVEKVAAEVLLDPRKRVAACAVAVVALLLLAYGAGRLFS